MIERFYQCMFRKHFVILFRSLPLRGAELKARQLVRGPSVASALLGSSGWLEADYPGFDRPPERNGASPLYCFLFFADIEWSGDWKDPDELLSPYFLRSGKEHLKGRDYAALSL